MCQRVTVPAKAGKAGRVAIVLQRTSGIMPPATHLIHHATFNYKDRPLCATLLRENEPRTNTCEKLWPKVAAYLGGVQIQGKGQPICVGHPSIPSEARLLISLRMASAPSTQVLNTPCSRSGQRQRKRFTSRCVWAVWPVVLVNCWKR
jgi:hypothetical protein